MGVLQLRAPEVIGQDSDALTSENGVNLNGLSQHTPDHSLETVDRNRLRENIVGHLKALGLIGELPSGGLPKDSIRQIHRFHREATHNRIRKALGNRIDQYLDDFADGIEVDPPNIQPELVPVRSGTRDAALFRFASLLWSIPVSQGYGRRLRFLVRDRNNSKLIGLFALGDPVFNLRVRDEWIGWDQEARRERLVNVMDAYVVGSVPPYSELLGGKLVSSMIGALEVSKAFDERYGNRAGLISGKRKNARLGLVTITSALGHSSIYNRLKLREEPFSPKSRPILELLKLGSTTGYGHFQIPDNLFLELRQVLQEDGHRYADGHQFGNGPNWRIRVMREALKVVGLNPNGILKHGIRREVYAMPLARNTERVLSGEDTDWDFDLRSVDEISAIALKRWVLPRACRVPAFQRFQQRDMLDRILLRGGTDLTSSS